MPIPFRIFFFSSLILLHLTTLTAPTESPTPTPPPQLLFVAELCRHGDRTPLKEFPSDALPVSKWPEGVGELTAIGQRAHFELGQRLRSRYVDTGFLSEAYKQKDIYIRSTDVDRTLVSAVAQMAGLYPPGSAPNTDVRVRFGKDPLHENEGGLPHLYQPVPIHTMSKSTDILLLPGANCPRHEFIMRQKSNSNEFKDKIASEQKFLDKVASVAGADRKNFTIFDLEHLSDTWTCFAAHSVPLPKKATPEIVQHAQNLSNWLITFGNEGLEVNRLRAGLILHEIKLRIVAAALRHLNKLPQTAAAVAKKFVLLSAHDTTLAATLSALQIFDGINPPYNSTLVWEFYVAADNSFLIRVEYNDQAVLLPGCLEEYCTLQQYLESTRERTVPGEGARLIECLTGWRRYAAMASTMFKKRTEDSELLVLPEEQNPATGGSGFGVSAIGLIGFISAIIALAGALRIRARYKGYKPAADQPVLLSDQETRPNANETSDRPILM